MQAFQARTEIQEKMVIKRAFKRFALAATSQIVFM